MKEYSAIMEYGNVKLTEHFSFLELCKTDRMELKKANIQSAKHPAIVRNMLSLSNLLLEPIRTYFGGIPITINSCYRNLDLNTAIKGSLTSDHMTGSAADFTIGDLSLTDVIAGIRKSGVIFGQLILEPNWIHLSLPQVGKVFGEVLQCKISGGQKQYSRYV